MSLLFTCPAALLQVQVQLKHLAMPATKKHMCFCMHAAGPSHAHMHVYTGGPSSLPPANQPGISTQAPHATPKSHAKAAGPMQGGKQPQGRSPKQEEQAQQPGAVKARGGGGLLLSQAGQGSTPLATQHHELGAEAGASVLPTVAVVGSVPGTSGPLSAVPLMLPEKISKAKV